MKKTIEKPVEDFRTMLAQRKYDVKNDDECMELRGILKITAKKYNKAAEQVRKEVAEELEKASATRSIVKPKYKLIYGAAGHCGDEKALAMKKALEEDGFTLEQIGEQNGINVMERWGHCNYGSRRMNLGNMLGARIRRKEKTIIGHAEFFAG